MDNHFYNIQINVLKVNNLDLIKKLKIVNVVSHCGHTRKYAPLKKHYETFKDKIYIHNNTHKSYVWLRSRNKIIQSCTSLDWNFHKYPTDEKGYLYKSAASFTSPLSDYVTYWMN